VGQIERIASTIAGGAIAAYGIRRRNPAGLALALLGGTVLFRGATGHCPVYSALGASTAPADEDIHLEDAVIINQPRAVLFAFWRELPNLAQFIPGVESVTPVGDTQIHWVAAGPSGRRISWDSAIIAEKKNALLTWRTLPESSLKHTASVRFVTLPHNRGTEVRMSIEYTAPGGRIPGSLARIFSKAPEQILHETLRRFRQIAESGEVATTEGQPKGS
jgi:uncharacterized membrane protein